MGRHDQQSPGSQGSAVATRVILSEPSRALIALPGATMEQQVADILERCGGDIAKPHASRERYRRHIYLTRQGRHYWIDGVRSRDRLAWVKMFNKVADVQHAMGRFRPAWIGVDVSDLANAILTHSELLRRLAAKVTTVSGGVSIQKPLSYS